MSGKYQHYHRKLCRFSCQTLRRQSISLVVRPMTPVMSYYDHVWISRSSFCHTNLTKVLLAKYTPPPLCKQLFESCTPDASVYMGMCALGDIWIGSCMGRLPSLSLLNIMINFGRTGQGEHYLFTSVLIRQVGDWFLPPFTTSK